MHQSQLHRRLTAQNRLTPRTTCQHHQRLEVDRPALAHASLHQASHLNGILPWPPCAQAVEKTVIIKPCWHRVARGLGFGSANVHRGSCMQQHVPPSGEPTHLETPFKATQQHASDTRRWPRAQHQPGSKAGEAMGENSTLKRRLPSAWRSAYGASSVAVTCAHRADGTGVSMQPLAVRLRVTALLPAGKAVSSTQRRMHAPQP